MPNAAITKIIIIIRIRRQKYDLAKFFKLTLDVPPKENTNSKINPTIGIENKISYPKYPQAEIGLYSFGISTELSFLTSSFIRRPHDKQKLASSLSSLPQYLQNTKITSS